MGQELLKSGVGLVNDVWKTGDIESARKRRGKEFVSNISTRTSNHMFGSGYMPQYALKGPQYKRTAGTRNTVKTKKSKTTNSKSEKTKPRKKKGKTKTKTKNKNSKKKPTKKKNSSHISKQQLIDDIFS